MAEQLEFYFPKTKSKHMAIPTTGKVYPSKGGTVRYGVQASMNGSMSLPKYVKENQFYDYGFGVDSEVRKYPQEFLDVFYDFDSYPTADTQDDETVEMAYQVWYQKQAENEVLNAEVSVGEKQVKSRKDYDIDNELSGFSNMEVGDIDLEDYEDEITESVEDEVIEAIRESVDYNMPISDGDSVTSHVNVDTELEITVPISGDIDFDWTANETHEEEVDEDEWNAESLDFHGENYQNHLKVIKKAPYGGIGSLLGIGGDTEIGGFSTGELTGSSAIHGDFDSASLNYSGHQNLQVRAETFGAFSIDEDDEGKIHIENKCDGCGKEFLFTQNSNIVGGNRAGAIVYENLDWKDEYGETGYDYPEYSPYGDLLCKSCWKINREEDENADSRGQGQYGAEMEECIACGNETFDGDKEVCIDCGSGMNLWSSEDSPSPSSPLEEVPATVPSPAEPTNESFNAEKVKNDLDYIKKLTDSFMSKNPTIIGEYGPFGYYKLYEHPVRGDTDFLYFYTPAMGGLLVQSALHHKDQMNDKDAAIVSNNLVKLLKQDNLYHTDFFGDENQLNTNGLYEGTQDVYFAEMDELSEDTSIIRNRVGDMVGMVELDENDEDIEKVDIDIIDDDGEMAYEGTLGADYTKGYTDTTEKIQYEDKYGQPKESIVQGLSGYAGNCPSCSKRINFPIDNSGLYCYDCQVYLRPSRGKGMNKTLEYDAETFESQGTNTKMILGITALAVGLGLWKGKEIMSLSDKITESIKNMRKK